MAVSSSEPLNKNPWLPLLRSTLSVVSISFLISALSLYLFDITSLSRLQLLILASTLPMVIAPIINWQHAQRIQIIENMQNDLQESNRHDEVTGLLSKRAFLESAQRELLLASRHAYPVSLVSLDSYDFKQLRKSHTDVMVDHVFKSCGNKLKEALRETDIIARYNDESFIVLMPHTDFHQAADVTTRLLQSISDTPIKLEQDDVFITLDSGISCSLEAGYSLQDLMTLSEEELYRAKAGRPQVSLAPTQMEA